MLAEMTNEEARATPAAARTYAIGDVHGRLDLLRLAVEAIEAHLLDGPFRVVLLGDYVDRGPDSRGVIDFLMELQKRWPVVCLKGNHEELMIQAVNQPGGGRLDRWLEHGGGETLRSYGVDPEDVLSENIPREHLRWMTALPKTTGDGHRIYVHAGLEPGTPIERQKEATFLWIRERFLQARASGFEAHIVHGHTPIWDGKRTASEPELLEHRTNLDTAAYATGVLTVAVFEAGTPGGPVEVLRICGEAATDDIPDEADEATVSPEAGAGEPEPARRGRLSRWFGRRGSRAVR
jgi:serine/threonine protein phosphatase 1